MRNTGKDIQKILDYQKKKEQAGTAQFHIDLEQGEIVYG